MGGWGVRANHDIAHLANMLPMSRRHLRTCTIPSDRGTAVDSRPSMYTDMRLFALMPVYVMTCRVRRVEDERSGQRADLAGGHGADPPTLRATR